MEGRPPLTASRIGDGPSADPARPRWAPWLLLPAAAGLLLLLGLVYAGFAGKGAAEKPLAPPGERANGGGHRYADPASCAGCHGGIASTYALTGMARSLSKVAAGSGNFAPGSHGRAPLPRRV